MEKYLKKLPFYDQTWFNFLRFLGRHFVEDDCQQKAASLTYTTLLSLVPMITVLLMILSTVPALESVREQISDVIYSNLLPQSSQQVSTYLNEFAEKSSNLTAIGAIVLFITTIMTLTTIERAFNKIWRVVDRSGGLKSILRYWTIITIGPLVLGTAFIISGTVQSLSFLNQEVNGYGIDWQFWLQLFSFAITVGGFIGMYWFIPKAKVPIKNAVIAGLVTAVLFELLKNLFGTVMANFTSYEAIYGAFAALPIFLLWIYLSWNLILLGVEISYTLTIFSTAEVYPRHPLLSLLDMLNLVYDHYQDGDSVTEEELRGVLGRKELPKWYTYLNYLMDSNLITLTEDDEYVLKRDLSGMTLWDFYQTLPYPLPIKDELDEMPQSQIEPWLSLLIGRFLATERFAESELSIPLDTILSHSKPRHKNNNPHPVSKPDDPKYQQRFTPQPYDSNADVVKPDENENSEAVIPKEEPATKAKDTARTSSDSTALKSTASKEVVLNREPEAGSSNQSIQRTNQLDEPKISKRRGLLGRLTGKSTTVITEDDNPRKR